MHSKNKRLLIYQRVITPYRYELLEKLSAYFKTITIISSYGEKTGATKPQEYIDRHNNVRIKWVKSINLPYSGESRSWSFFLYPQSVIQLLGEDIVLVEGVSNLANNIYLVPLAKLFRKKVIWWDAGYSPKVRSLRRQKIDAFASHLINMTDRQIAYSSYAKGYMEQYMRASNCSLVLNTISTTYFENIYDEVVSSVKEHKIINTKIKLLYVGAIEKRKRVDDLILLIHRLNENEKTFHLTIIGDGDELETCKNLAKNLSMTNIEFAGRQYDKDKLKHCYFSSDLFVMPGDGGLAIAQSLLFGLPAVCVASDRTEEDYIDDKRYILNEFGELEVFLQTFHEYYDRHSVLTSIDRLQDKKFIDAFVKAVGFDEEINK